MNKIELMKVFLCACEKGSFVKASHSMNMSAPAVTRAISQLEQYLGISLFLRTTRRISLTDAGTIYRQECERILEAIELAEELVTGSYASPKGTLRISAPLMFGQLHITPIVSEFLDLYKDVDVRLMLQDHIIDLMQEHIEIALRIGHLEDSGLYAHQVGHVKQLIVASPEYLKQFGTPSSPSDLQNHQVISASAEGGTTTWKFMQGGSDSSVKLKPRFITNSNNASVKAALMHQGLVRRMSYQVGDALLSGKLVRVLEDFESKPLPVNLVHFEGRRANARTKMFIEFAAQKLKFNPVLQSHG